MNIIAPNTHKRGLGDMNEILSNRGTLESRFTRGAVGEGKKF